MAASASERDEHLAGGDGAVAARLQFDRAAPGRAADRSPAPVPSRRSPAGAREATASELGSAVVNQFRIWLARHCRLSFRLALSSEITRIPEARSKGSPRGSVFFALLTRSKTSFTDLNRVTGDRRYAEECGVTLRSERQEAGRGEVSSCSLMTL